MRKFALLALLAAALAIPSIAAADATPQGELTGRSGAVDVHVAVVDGGTSYVGRENDKSGNCNGDGGEVFVGPGIATSSVVCAHYVASSGCCNPGSPKMRFAAQVSPFDYIVFRVTDNGPLQNGQSPDTVFVGAPLVTLAQATAWVNTGRVGSGIANLSWVQETPLNGDFTITASQS